MPTDGYIKLHRQITEWEWYDQPNMLCVFIHLLLKACYREYKWHGITLLPGQLVIGRNKFAQECGLSEQCTRSTLNRLKSTNEITIDSTNAGSLVTIVKWRDYQCMDDEINQQINQPFNQQSTSDQPATNQQLTTREEGKKERRKDISPVVVVKGGPLLTESEQDTLGQAYRDSMAAIETKALAMKMLFGETDRVIAESYMADYSAEWVLEAMSRAAKGPARTWAYIEAILKRWKVGGGIDGPGAHRTSSNQLRGNDTPEPPGGVSDGLTAVKRF